MGSKVKWVDRVRERVRGSRVDTADTSGVAKTIVELGASWQSSRLGGADTSDSADTSDRFGR